MNITEMYDFVRAHADTDATDAPDATLSVYARVAYNYILSHRNDWPHLNVDYTFTSVDGTAEYTIATALSVADMQYVSAVQEPGTTGFPLTYADRESMEALFGNTSVGSRPMFWTVANDRIILYPTPRDATTYRVRGYRAPATFPQDASSTPDLPLRLHDAIPFFMLAQYYRAQEEQGLANDMMGEFEAILQRHLTNNPSGALSHKPMIWGGQQLRGLTYADWVRRNVEG